MILPTSTKRKGPLFLLSLGLWLVVNNNNDKYSSYIKIITKMKVTIIIVAIMIVFPSLGLWLVVGLPELLGRVGAAVCRLGGLAVRA